MPKDNENETLAQQRKARKEFLELKKMQSGEIEVGPKPSEIAIVPKTPLEKLKNIWFHDKWYILGTMALVAIIAILITQCVNKTDYDLEVVLFTHTAIIDQSNDDIADYLEQFCEDINGDGEVNIIIINCSYNSSGNDKQYQYTMASKLQAVIAADANALLYITDDSAYEYLNNLTTDGDFFDGEPVLLNEKFYESCSTNEYLSLPEGLHISCRRVSDTTIEKDKNIKLYYEQSQNILKGISE